MLIVNVHHFVYSFCLTKALDWVDGLGNDFDGLGIGVSAVVVARVAVCMDVAAYVDSSKTEPDDVTVAVGEIEVWNVAENVIGLALYGFAHQSSSAVRFSE